MKLEVTQILSIAQHGATSTLLSIGEKIKILVNCGLPSDFSLDAYLPYKSILEEISLVVLTSPSLTHCGAFPFLDL